MDLEFFIHGVPKGQKIWGKNDDSTYLNSLYDVENNKEETKFLVDVRTINGQYYCYYSYLKYNNVSDYEGRRGAYWGISVRTDQYCSHLIGMYQLLDIIYNRYVLGCLLKKENNQLRFIVSDFETKDLEIREIEKSFRSLLQLSFEASDFQNIDSLRMKISEKLIRFNWCDYDKVLVEDYIKKSNKREFDIRSKNIRLKIRNIAIKALNL